MLKFSDESSNLTQEFYQRCLLQRPLLSRFADRFELRCIQLLSIHCVAMRPAL